MSKKYLSFSLSVALFSSTALIGSNGNQMIVDVLISNVVAHLLFWVVPAQFSQQQKYVVPRKAFQRTSRTLYVLFPIVCVAVGFVNILVSLFESLYSGDMSKLSSAVFGIVLLHIAHKITRGKHNR